MTSRTGAYLALLRPANVVTAAADILAGYAAAGCPAPRVLPPLLFSGMALYGGGVVLNDVCDRDLDARERPERPIPSGRIAASHAAAAGAGLLIAGVAAAFAASWASGMIASAVAGMVVLYDAWAKHRTVVGPVVMGACRGGNLLLGLSAAPLASAELWYLALFPLAYVGGVTVMSRGEVLGGTRRTSLLGAALIVAVFGGIGLLCRSDRFQWWWAALPLLFLAYRVMPGLWHACLHPSPANLRAAVRSGVLSLVVLDATIATGFAGPWYGAAVLALLGVAAWLARPFAVT